MAERTPASLRAKRVLAIMHRLRPDTAVSVAELAELTGASASELLADLETLTMCGIEPYTPGDLVSGYVEDGVFHTWGPLPALDRPVRLTVAEARALVTALELCEERADGALFRKLISAAGAEFDAERVDREVRAAAAPGGPISKYSAMAGAARSRVKVRISYWSAGRGETAQRTVHPYALGMDRGSWYLSAFCERAGAVRTFRLDRIRELAVLDEGFQPPSEAPVPSPAFTGEGLPVAEVLFDAGEDVSERDWPGAVFEPRGDRVLARVPYSSAGWVARRVAARLGAAEVLSPPEVREAVRRIAEGPA